MRYKVVKPLAWAVDSRHCAVPKKKHFHATLPRVFFRARVEMLFRPLSTGSRKIHVHLVDVDSMEIVGAWLATATAMPPVVTKSYEVDLPLGRDCHKRIAYSNPWSATRLFRLASSDPKVLRPRYESLEVNDIYLFAYSPCPLCSYWLRYTVYISRVNVTF